MSEDHFRNFIDEMNGVKVGKREVDLSDLRKIEAALHEAYMFFRHRDEMNANLHRAKKTICSPLTTELGLAWQRLQQMIDGERVGHLPGGFE